MPVNEASTEETPYGRYVTSDGWFVLHYPASEVAAKYGASAAEETDVPDEAYADWPGDFAPTRVPWPPES